MARLAGKVETRNSQATTAGESISEGVYGLKALGVRDMTYKLAFLASMVQSADARVSTSTVFIMI